jgi:hypothetical protein
MMNDISQREVKRIDLANILIVILKILIWASLVGFFFKAAYHARVEMSSEEVDLLSSFITSGHPYEFFVMLIMMCIVVVAGIYKIIGWMFDLHGVRKLKKKIKALEACPE